MTIPIDSVTSIAGGGVVLARRVVRNGDAPLTYDVALPVAYSGTLSTRTSDTAGELTVVTGHTIETGDVFDIHWVDAGVKKVTYGCTAGTVAAPDGDTAIPFTGGTGDALPIATTAVVFCEQKEITTHIDGDNVVIIGIGIMTSDPSQDLGGHVQFNDSGAAEIAELDFDTNVPLIWDISGGSANPFTGNPIVQALASHANVDATKVVSLRICGAVVATP